MKERIQEKSRTITDPAGREVRILEDRHALVIADECHFSLHEVYRLALKLGIYPYRYLRNRDALSQREQLKLAESRVAVVGAGGLGGHVILLLARIGIGHLVVVDHDVFDETNLNRQALCTAEALGRPKAEEASAVVALVNPGVQVTSHRIRIEPSNAAEILAGSDVAVDALDNIQDRFTLEKATKSVAIPLVHGALAGFEGRVMTIFPEDPGLVQLYGGDAVAMDDSPRPEAVLGVPALTPAVIATLQAMEVIKIILKRGRVFRNTMAHADLEAGELRQFVFDSSDDQ
jgi:molybdopterin/thiamine biosynthesis adenylyltransferase